VNPFLTSLIGAALLAPGASEPPSEIPIIVDVEELPGDLLDEIVLRGRTYDRKTTFELSLQKSLRGPGQTEIHLTVGRRRFERLHLAYLPFDSVDVASITTHSRLSPDGRVFRVRLRYGAPAPHCQIGDDGRGKVTITYVGGRAPQVDHSAPAIC
jgi:hypothetical protein